MNNYEALKAKVSIINDNNNVTSLYLKELLEGCKDMQDTLDRWNLNDELQKKDNKIKELEDKINRISSKSLVILSDSAKEKLDIFKKEHCNMHGSDCHMGKQFTYTIDEYKTGYSVYVKCPECGETSCILDESLCIENSKMQ